MKFRHNFMNEYEHFLFTHLPMYEDIKDDLIYHNVMGTAPIAIWVENKRDGIMIELMALVVEDLVFNYLVKGKSDEFDNAVKAAMDFIEGIFMMPIETEALDRILPRFADVVIKHFSSKVEEEEN